VSRLAFLSPHPAYAVSPLRHVRADAFRDVSALGKLEIRGELGAIPDVIPIGPGRGLLVVDGDLRETSERLSAAGYRVYDMTAAFVALEVEGEDLMRRLTELDLEALPAIGSFARGTRALIERRNGARFRVFVPHELGHYVAEVIVDTAAGLGR